MIKFRTGAGYGSGLIEKIDVERETKNSVWVNGRRNAKKSEYDKYWDSWEEAHSYLLDEASRSLEKYQRLLEAAQRKYDSIKNMKAP